MSAIPAEVSSRRRRWIAVAVVSLAAAGPRLAVVAHERAIILEQFVDKSDRFAMTLVKHGTFGFLAGRPSADTQPLYGWFLAGLYWPFGHSWLAVGLAQTLVGVATALLVLAIGTHLHSLGVGTVAALLTTLHPYVVWHDVHANREVLDGLALTLVVLLALLAYEDGTAGAAAVTGCAVGIAILGNARLAILPFLLAPYVAWRVRPGLRALVVGICVIAGGAVVIAPWVARNKAEVGCYTITTDSRALWKANNPATYGVLAHGGWIDNVPNLRGAPPWPELAADLTLAGKPTYVNECAQQRFYQRKVIDFWRDHQGEKARLAVQAVRMLWGPSSTISSEKGGGGLAKAARDTIEPLYVVVLYGLALVGLFLAPRRFVVLALLLEAYNTVAAMVFAGTIRYRVPWDFLLALLASFTLVRAWEWLRNRRRRAYEPFEPTAVERLTR